jgi:hypothetical protein
MATKKDAADTSGDDVTTAGAGARTKQLEDRRKRRQEAVTVTGEESFPPPGMDLPDGGQVPFDEPA